MANKNPKEIRTSLRLEAEDASKLRELRSALGMNSADVLRALLRAAHQRFVRSHAKSEAVAMKKNILGEQ